AGPFVVFPPGPAAHVAISGAGAGVSPAELDVHGRANARDALDMFERKRMAPTVHLRCVGHGTPMDGPVRDIDGPLDVQLGRRSDGSVVGVATRQQCATPTPDLARSRAP